MVNSMMALGALVVYGGLALVARSLMHRRRTGSTGFRVDRTIPAGLVASAVITGGHVLAAIGTVLAIGGGSSSSSSGWAEGTGAVVFLAGLVLVVWAQGAMGESWRMGVDPAELTTLVTSGPFQVVRNPIFVGMALCLAGVALLATSVVAAVGAVVFVIGAEIQVRLVEEPYLRAAQGRPFEDYVHRTGRFVPALGRH
jgi:protein-S-isoprenylcysteine O-methyltransferase Ste14